MKKRVLSLVLALAMCLSLLPTGTFAAANIQYPTSGDQLVAWVNRAAAGTVFDLGGQSLTVNDDNSDNSPWAITKAVTIKNGTIDLRCGGIVLGANVTFQDIQLSFLNPARNVIAANGYTLTLNNATRAKTNYGTNASQQVHLFCGTMLSSNGTVGSVSIPSPGTHGSIVITGSNIELGNIYAGHLSTDGTTLTASDIPATVTIDATGQIGMDYSAVPHGYSSHVTLQRGLYATGAIQTPNPDITLDSTYEQCPPLPRSVSNIAPVTNAAVTVNLGGGNVNISSQTIPYINGATAGTGRTSVVFQAGSNPVDGTRFHDVAALTISKGRLAPHAESDLSGTTVAVSSNGILDLNNIDEAEVSSFVGGGQVWLDQLGSLSINGAVSGTTEVAIEGTTYGGNNSTGIPSTGHNYIAAPSSQDDAFLLLPSQNFPSHQLVNNNGSWSIPSGTPVTPMELSSFEVTQTNHETTTTVVNDMLTDGYGIGVTYECGDTVYLSEVPLTIQVTYGSQRATATKTEGDFGYIYTINALNMELFALDGNFDGPPYPGTIYVSSTDGNSISARDYTIKITAPLEGGKTVTKTLILTVTEDTPSSGDSCQDGHTIGYTSSGATITESCTVENIELGTATISAENRVYSGSPYNGTSVTGTGSLNSQQWDITYEGSGGTSYASSLNAPTNAGT